MDDEITTVIFRVWRDSGDVFALFPDHDEGGGLCSAFQHVGQHSGANYGSCIAQSRPATAVEYAPLKAELEAAPYQYRLRVRRRRVR